MYYISKGLKERGFEFFGKIAAVLFAIFCIGGSFGGGNAAQSNQATIVLKDLIAINNNVEAIRTLMNIYGTLGDNPGYVEMRNLLDQQE